jgi:hypothetical protein
LPEHFKIKVTTIEESKDLAEMKIEELVGFLQTYEYSLPPDKKTKTIALKASKKKAKDTSEEDFDNEEYAVAMLAKNFGRLMKNDDAGGSKSEDAELSDYTLMALNYLEQADQRKIGKKS